MLQNNNRTAWNNFLTFAAKKCSKVEYKNWIEPISLLKVTDESVLVEVPNIFVQEYLMDNYRTELASFLPVNEKNKVCIDFVVGNNNKKTEIQPSTNTLSTNKPTLNSKYTFDNFVEGVSNKFAKAAAINVATNLSTSYNPLFLHGSVGLGKTHLLHSICHLATKKNKHICFQCITTEQFINKIVESLRNKSIDKLKYFYRNLDLLVVDDIQFLQNRKNFEEEFCTTFETLINQGKQVIITSDKAPSDLQLSSRLTARMEWGLVASIGTPDLETRVAILQHKAEKKGFKLPSNVAFFIAKHIRHNVRQLEGAINKLNAYLYTAKNHITESFVKETLSDLLQYSSRQSINVDNILHSVSQNFDVSIKEIKGTSKIKPIAFARQVAMYLAKEMVNSSLKKISYCFGGKTHSTLIHSWYKIKNLLQKDPSLRQKIECTKTMLG